LSSILIYNTHRWQYNIKGDVKRMNRWFVYRNKKRTSVCIVYIFSSSSRYDDFVITVFHETDLLFALSFFFLFVKVNWLWLYMQIFFSMCTKCWYITFKKHIKQEKKKKNLVKAKKIKMRFGWMIFEIKKFSYDLSKRITQFQFPTYEHQNK